MSMRSPTVFGCAPIMCAAPAVCRRHVNRRFAGQQAERFSPRRSRDAIEQVGSVILDGAPTNEQTSAPSEPLSTWAAAPMRSASRT